jgi:hypothetical protein
MKIERIKKYTKDLSKVYKRFPLAIFFAAVTTVLLIVHNSMEDGLSIMDIGYIDDGWLWLHCCPFGSMIIAFTVALFFETRQNKNRLFLVQIISNVFWAILCAFLIYFYKPMSDGSFYYSMAACFIVIFAAPPVVLFLNQKDDVALIAYSKNLSNCTSFAVGISLGICGCICLLILCIYSLFDISAPGYLLYSNVLIFSLSFLVPFFTFGAVPDLSDSKSKEELENVDEYLKKMEKIPTKSVLPIIVSIFLLIMYGHVIKAIFVSDEVGLISLYASMAIALVLLFVRVQYPKINKIILIASIPLLIAFAFDSVRFTLANPTPEKLYLVLFCFWSIASIAFILQRPERCIRWIIISFSALALVSSIGPQRMCNVVKLIPKKEWSSTQKANKPSKRSTVSEKIHKKSVSETSKNGEEKVEKKEPLYYGSSAVVDVPQDFPKALHVSLFFFGNRGIKYENGILSFPVYPGDRDDKVITRFEVPVDTFVNISKRPKPNKFVLQNDSTVLAITYFKLDYLSKNVSFQCRGILFLKNTSKRIEGAKDEEWDDKLNF